MRRTVTKRTHKVVLQRALEAEMRSHLGSEWPNPVGHLRGTDATDPPQKH